MIARLWLLLCPWVWLTCYFGGRSSASTSTTTTYNVSDDRIAAAEGAQVFRAGAEQAIGGGSVNKTSVSGTGNRVESLSDDVVFAAFDYAKSRDALAGETLDNVFKSTADLYGRANDAFLVANTAPRGLLTERTLLAGGALLAVLAFAFLRMRKA
jgi:hypothetical protein